MAYVTRISVIGAGIMGSGIAQVAAQAGYPVIMRDIDMKFVEKGFEAIRKSLSLLERKGKITADDSADIIDRIKGTIDIGEAAQQCDLVIEAAPENQELKRKLFAELDVLCPVKTILASNTSSISITSIGTATNRRDKVIGMHFSNPVPVMTGVELIRGYDTSQETVDVIKEVAKQMGKESFVSADVPGFISNRLLQLFINEAFYVLRDGIATAEDIDKACQSQFRHPMGPLATADLIGLDTVLSILEYEHRELGEKFRPCPLLKQMVTAGYLGRKTGRGVFTYS